jgi:hypothetical protein
MQVFTGHAETTPLALMLRDNVPVSAPLDFIKAQKIMEVEKLSKTMTEIHAQVVRNPRVIARLLFQSITKRRTCGRRTSRWDATCLSWNSARAVCPSCRLVEGPAPRREFGVRLRVHRRESTHERAEGRARNTIEIL